MLYIWTTTKIGVQAGNVLLALMVFGLENLVMGVVLLLEIGLLNHH